MRYVGKLVSGLQAGALGMLACGSALADDIDVYTSQIADSLKPNILFVLDYSGSMAEDVNGVMGGSPMKIDLLKDAVNALLDQNAGRINVGIGSIYNNQPSGVRWPISDLEADANTIDPEIPAGQFTVREVIAKQLERVSADGSTSTVNALAEAAMYFKGNPVMHNHASVDQLWNHKPDTWHVTNQRYQDGNPYAALPSSYSPKTAYNGTTAGSGYAWCNDYTPSGGVDNCASLPTFECHFVAGGSWSSDTGTQTSDDRNACKYTVTGGWTTPNYISPITNECQPNYMVLISDGQPTVRHDNPTLADMAGKPANACTDLSSSIFGAAVNTATAGNCGPEIVHELANNDQVATIPDSKVKTYTIGFSVAGPGQDYLKLLAAEGQGEFFEANNPQGLTDALNAVIDDILSGSENFASMHIDVDSASFSHDNRAYFSLFSPSSKRTWGGNLKGYFLDSGGFVDTNNQPAVVVDSDGAVFADTAQSFWSVTTDGNDVLAGGASEVLQGGGRMLYTFTGGAVPGGGQSLTDAAQALDASNTAVTDALLGLPAGSPDRAAILSWLETAPMGDPLHTQPVTIDYAGRRVVYTMTNQGFLHAIDGSYPVDPTAGDHSGGNELFAFMPQALLANLPAVYAAGTQGGHVYGLDGDITVWHDDNDGNGIVDGSDTVLLLLGMRRGGTHYYALDVTNPTAPSLEWRIDGGSTGFERLAQSWSRMSLITVNNGGSAERVAVFGGGYDPALDGAAKRTAALGNAIYMVSKSGNLIWSVDGGTATGMDYAIPADLTVIDSDADGLADRLYAADVGGQIWRVDFDDVSSSANFTTTRLADLGSTAAHPFFYPPSVSLSNPRGASEYLSISIGSGDRTDPLKADSSDAFFVLRDESVGKGTPAAGFTTITKAMLYDATANDVGSSNAATAASARSALNAADGWYVTLTTGEKALSAVVTFENNLLATTYDPNPDGGAPVDPCEFTSAARFYMMSVADGQPQRYLDDGSVDQTAYTSPADRARDINSTGIPSSPVVVFPKSADSVEIYVDKESVNLLDQRLTRVYWYPKN